MDRPLPGALAVCAGCGERIGVYEPVWRIDPRDGAELTGWLSLTARPRPSLESLWHAQCAERDGVAGG